jgi:hypothetical protein
MALASSCAKTELLIKGKEISSDKKKRRRRRRREN